MSTALLTIFSCPKVFSGHSALIQDNALNSWMRLPQTQVMLFGPDVGVAEAACSRGFTHFPAVKRSVHGTPFLDDMFRQAQEQAHTPLVCFVNADIILPPEFPAVAAELATLLPTFLAVGQRWNIPVTELLNFSRDADTRLKNLCAAQGKLYSPTGMDFFIFPRGMISEIPPFCIGRPVWDNWMVWNAKKLGIPVVNLSGDLIIYHQEHSYAHVPGGNGRDWTNSPEAEYNYTLVASLRNFRPILQTTLHADFIYTGNVLRRSSVLRRLYWNFLHCCLLRVSRLCGKIFRKLCMYIGKSK